MDLGVKIGKHISAIGLKQSFVAGKAGIPTATLSQITTGKRRVRADEYIRLCDALNLDPRDFATQ
jgi:transcriptional regulator with XRE-family HTH domain